MTKTQFMTSVNEAFKTMYGIRYSEMLSIAPSIDYGTQKLSHAYEQNLPPQYFASLIGDNLELSVIPEDASEQRRTSTANLNFATISIIEMARDPGTDFVLSKSYPLRAICERDGSVYSIKPSLTRNGQSQFAVEICTDKNVDIRSLPIEFDGMLRAIDKTAFGHVANACDMRYAFEAIHEHEVSMKDAHRMMEAMSI